MANKISRRAFLGTAASLALGAGCQTADYNKGNVNLLSGDLQNIPGQGESTSCYQESPSLNLRQTRQVLGKYNGLPKHNTILFTPEESVNLDTTGPLDGRVAYGVHRLEQSFGCVGECSVQTGFYFGDPDAGKPLARQNQLSNRSRLQGIESISDCGSYFFVDVKERTRLNKRLHEQSDYQVAVTFGQSAFEAIKTRKDAVYLLTVAEDAGIGFAVTGNWIGAAIGSGIGLVQGVECYINGLRPPRGSLLVDNSRTITGLPRVPAQTYQTLRNAEKLNATETALLNWQKNNQNCSNPCAVPSQGTGIVYAQGAKNIRFGASEGECLDTICFDTTRQGINHLLYLINRGLWGFLRFGIDKQIKYRENCPPHGGGRSGWNGGNGEDPGCPEIGDGGRGSGAGGNS